MRSRIRPLALALILALAGASSLAGPNDPIAGDAFHELVAAQDVDLQRHLRTVVSESEGYHVTGPLAPWYAGDDDTRELFHSVRVTCPSIAHLERALDRLESSGLVREAKTYLDEPRRGSGGFRGAVLQVQMDGFRRALVVTTLQQTRWLIWLRDAVQSPEVDTGSDAFIEYARAVSDHLRRVDEGMVDEDGPPPERFGLGPAAAFYPPHPPYVIEGYENYKRFLHDNAGIRATFATGVLAFVPTDSLREALIAGRPQRAYPNKEQPVLQHEYRKFFARGGDPAAIRTLDKATLATLQPGEYFYAVGPSGEVRFGYEIPREEVARVEEETGRKVARANHAFLFPGEPVLTAGAFFVEGDIEPRIVEVNTHSGHYFYSNVSKSVRQDIAVRSNEYLLTIGHFFDALDRLGIATERILVGKM